MGQSSLPSYSTENAYLPSPFFFVGKKSYPAPGVPLARAQPAAQEGESHSQQPDSEPGTGPTAAWQGRRPWPIPDRGSHGGTSPASTVYRSPSVSDHGHHPALAMAESPSAGSSSGSSSRLRLRLSPQRLRSPSWCPCAPSGVERLFYWRPGTRRCTVCIHTGCYGVLMSCILRLDQCRGCLSILYMRRVTAGGTEVTNWVPFWNPACGVHAENGADWPNSVLAKQVVRLPQKDVVSLLLQSE